MDLEQQRKRCEARIRDLEIPVPFDIRSFCQALGARRGRPISLMPMESKSGPCGLWIATPTADFLFYERETSPLHQNHIILHEASHLLCGHDPALVSDTEVSQQLFPHVEPEVVQRILARASYTGEQEREAELLASLILERVSGLTPLPDSAPDVWTAELLQRLETSLEQGSGHP